MVNEIMEAILLHAHKVRAIHRIFARRFLVVVALVN